MSFFSSTKYHSRTVLKPGEGARALRFHDLSRRGSRVVGRSDAVLHRFGEAKPSRNGCIVVRPQPAGALFFLLSAKQRKQHLIFSSRNLCSTNHSGGGKKGVCLMAVDFLKCVADKFSCCFLFRLKYHSRTVLKPGEGARALRFAPCPFPGAPSPSTHKRLLAVQMPVGI